MLSLGKVTQLIQSTDFSIATGASAMALVSAILAFAFWSVRFDYLLLQDASNKSLMEDKSIIKCFIALADMQSISLSNLKYFKQKNFHL